MDEIIQQWINAGKEYNAGIRILEIHAKLPAAARSLLLFKNPEKLQKLLYELGNIDQVNTKTVEIPAKKAVQIQKAHIAIKASNEEYEAKLAKARDMWKQAGNAHSQLKMAKSQHKRKGIAFFIIKTTEKAVELFKQCTFFEQHGHFYSEESNLSENDNSPKIDRAEAYRRRNCCRSNIASYKKRLQNAEGQNAIAIQLKIDRWRAEVEELNIIINGTI